MAVLKINLDAMKEILGLPPQWHVVAIAASPDYQCSGPTDLLLTVEGEGLPEVKPGEMLMTRQVGWQMEFVTTAKVNGKPVREMVGESA